MLEKDYQILRIAELYYKQSYSQQQIATMLGTSRPTVSRLLNEAKEKGIVEININTPVNINYDLSTDLKEKFKLKDVLVVNANDNNESLAVSQVGQVAARLAMSVIKDDMVIGVSFGKHVKHVIESIPYRKMDNIRAVQLVGALGNGDPNTDGPELVIDLANRLNGEYRYINSPTVVDAINVRISLLPQNQIKRFLEFTNLSDVAIDGINSLDEEHSSLKRSGYIDERLRNKS